MAKEKDIKNNGEASDLFFTAYDYNQEVLVKYLLKYDVPNDKISEIEELIDENCHFCTRLAEIKNYLTSVNAQTFEEYERQIELEAKAFVKNNVSDIRIKKAEFDTFFDKNGGGLYGPKKPFVSAIKKVGKSFEKTGRQEKGVNRKRPK